jgi:8-oxo-dGTP pyrophosphatase MutT (NUDIX family)
MNTPTLKDLNEVRKTGFRPSVICCCINDKKVLLMYKKEFSMWMFPQGGVNNKEEINQAALREITTELGQAVRANCVEDDILVFGDDQIEFLPEKQIPDGLQTDEGVVQKMLGKKYYFCAIASKSDVINIGETEFDDHYWLEYQPAMFLAKKVHQPGKKRITMKALNLLKELDLIS